MNIYESISAVMSEIGAITKSSRNLQQNFMYRGVDAVYNALQPALIKHKVFVVPEVLEQTREERKTKSGSGLIYSLLKIKFTFYAEDGTSVSAVVIGEGMDSGDKASNKAMSVAFKYACFEVFCIPTDEMKDPDEETPPPSEPKKQAKSEFVTDKHVDALTALLGDVGYDEKKFAVWYKANLKRPFEGYEKITMEDYARIADFFDKLREKKVKAAAQYGA